tara:strand:+ start:2445 stop:3719 length:1275 start_codon:yes stop_codon:yes gene_type:complete
MNRLNRVFFIDGVRTPFQMSGTGYKNLDCYQLASHSLSGLKDKFNFIKDDLDSVIFGTVIQDSKTSNIARESMLISGYQQKIPANTVTMACISSNKAITDGFNSIATNNASSIVVGGVETMSDVPIKLSKPLRKTLLESRKWKTNVDKLKGISSIKVKDIGIEVPSITEFSTNETMGYSADKLSNAWGVSRKDQDEFAVRSHLLASKAQQENLLTDVLSINIPDLVSKDNIIKHDSSIEKLKKLKPVFIKKFGTITAGNASSLTDGASSALICDQNYIKKYNLHPKSEIIDYIYYGSDPKEELLLGPAYATSLLLEKNKLKISDIDVVEFHEAFAGQVLANLNAMDSDKFASDLNLKTKVGLIPIEKINNWGGSLSLGHPFGATGVRLLSMASNRLKESNGEYGLITACAAGGLGHAMLIKNYI